MRHFAALKLEARVDPKPDPNLSPAASGRFMGLDQQVVVVAREYMGEDVLTALILRPPPPTS